MLPTIRAARAADRATAIELWAALHREHEAHDARYRIAEDAAQRWATDIREWIRSPQDGVWLADAENAVVGLLTAHLYEPTPTFQPLLFLYVDDLYVRPPWRGSGVGRALLDAATAWGKERGAVEVRAGVLASNPSARGFWQAVGATDYSVTVTAPLT